MAFSWMEERPAPILQPFRHWHYTCPATRFTFINPNEISDVQVLKRCLCVSAIYGSRGANGVVLITTKKRCRRSGRALMPTPLLGFSDEMRKIDVLDAGEYRSALAKYQAPCPIPALTSIRLMRSCANHSPKNYSLALSGGSEKCPLPRFLLYG